MVLSQGNIVYSRELFLRLKWVLCPIILMFPPIRLFSKSVYSSVAISANNLLRIRDYIITKPEQYNVIAIQNENNKELVVSIFALKRFFPRIKNKYFLTDTSRSEVLVVKLKKIK